MRATPKFNLTVSLVLWTGRTCKDSSDLFNKYWCSRSSFDIDLKSVMRKNWEQLVAGTELLKAFQMMQILIEFHTFYGTKYSQGVLFLTRTRILTYSTYLHGIL